MTPIQFAQLVESIRQAGRIRRGESKPAREFVLPAANVEILGDTAKRKRPLPPRGDR